MPNHIPKLKYYSLLEIAQKHKTKINLPIPFTFLLKCLICLCGMYLYPPKLFAQKPALPPISSKTDTIKISKGLKEIIIKGETVSQQEAREIRQSPFAASVLEGKYFANKATDISHVISQIPGISIRNEGGLGSPSRLNIHGLEGRRIALFINGDPIYSPDGNFAITDIPVQVIKRIEVYKGIIPAQYGSDGLGGTVNIETLDIYNRDYIDITHQYGSFNTHRSTAILKKWLAKPGILFGCSGFFNYSDNNYMMDVPDQEIQVRRNHDQYTSGAVFLKAEFKKWWFDLANIEYSHYINRKDIQGLRNDIREAQSTSSIGTLGFKLEKKKFLLKKLDFISSTNIPISRNTLTDTGRYIWDFRGNHQYSHTGGELDQFPHQLINKQNAWIQRLNLQYSFNTNHRINLNHAIKYSHLTSQDEPAFRLAGYHTSSYPSSLFTQITSLAYQYSTEENKLQNQLLIKRYYVNSQVIDTKHRRLQEMSPENQHVQSCIGYGNGTSLLICPSLRAKISYERSFRLPDPEELFGDGIFIAPSNNLIPEQGDNFNASLQLSKEDFWRMKKFQLEISGFYKRINHMIRLLSDGFVLGYTNIDQAKVEGVEMECKMDLTSNWYAHLNWTYQNLRDIARYVPGTTIPSPTYGLRLPNIPWIYGSFGIEYHKQGLFSAYKPEHTRIYAESSYTGSYYFNWDISKNQDRTIPELFYHTLGLEQSFLHGKYTLGAEVRNLTDEKVYNQYNMPLPGRSINFKLRYIWYPKRIQ